MPPAASARHDAAMQTRFSSPTRHAALATALLIGFAPPAIAEPHARCPASSVAKFAAGVLSCETTIVTIDVAPTACDARGHACGVVVDGLSGAFVVASGRDHCDHYRSTPCGGSRAPSGGLTRVQVSPTCPAGTTLQVDAGPGHQDRCRATAPGWATPIVAPF